MLVGMEASGPRLSPKIEICSSRVKVGFVALFFGLPLLVLIPALSVLDRHLGVVLVTCFCVLGAGVFSYLCLNPYKLALDDAGFTLSGGFSKRATRVMWEDVDHFCVDYEGRGVKSVGYRFVPGREPPARFSWLHGRGSLPSCWPGSAEEMVERLNKQRRRALAVDVA
jgi:hypothetical protein